MKNITNTEALDIISSLGVSYVMEKDNMNFLIKNKSSEQLKDDEVLLIISEWEDGDFVNVIPLAYTFDIEKMLSVVNAKAKRPILLINIHALSNEFVDKLDSILKERATYDRTYTDYAYLSGSKPEVSTDIRLLTEGDKDAFIACSDEQLQYRPPLAVLFDIMITKGQGYILGAFDGEKIVGYLCFVSAADNVYDVDYIYTAPDSRGKGIGAKLGAAYVSYSLENDHIAYWSNAKNEASAKTALKIGLEKIRVVNKYVVNDN